MTITFGDRLTVSYETDNLRMSVYGRLSSTHYHYNMTPEFNSHPLDLNYGFDARYSVGKFNIRSEISDEYCHGYLSSTLNRHRWIWNAEAGLKVLNNNGKLVLGMRDILNQSKFNYSNVSAYERSEFWSDEFSHYVYVGFTYSFKPREKGHR